MKHILRDEHDDLGNDLPGGPVAWRVGSQIFQQEHLAKLHSGGVRKPVEPLHLHADPAEVERLRVERRKMDGALVACANERDELRAQVNDWTGKWEKAIKAGAVLERKLAERDALLQKTAAAVREYAGDYSSDHAEHWQLHGLADEAQALSASAEPKKEDQ